MGRGWSLVFGFSFGTLRLSTLVLAAVGGGALYYPARARGVAAGGAARRADVAANPAFLLLSSSFMTDVPFVAFTLLALCTTCGRSAATNRRCCGGADCGRA